MAKYTFRIHEITESNEGTDGWLKSDGIQGENITKIPDSLEKATDNKTGKIGTSIPTPLARIYLFETAYKVLHNVYVRNQQLGVVNNSFEGSYAELVSDSLDLLQLLFEKGNDPKLKYYTWNYENTITELEKASDSHKLLAEALKMAFKSSNFDKNIKLIVYDDILMGGLSPYTLVYTSANLRREIAKRRLEGTFDCSSNKKVEFFGKTPTKLSERSEEFQEYLLSLIKCNKDIMDDNASQFFNFTKYIKDSVNQEIANKINNTNDLDIQKNFEENNKKFEELLEVRGIALRWNDRVPDLETKSYFVMDPNKEIDEYKKYINHIPLVLPESFTDSGNYVYIDDYWDTNTRIKQSKCYDNYSGKYKGKQIGERRLPKNGGYNGEESTVRYPWVSDTDFLYDNIINLGYAINTEKYCLGEVKSNGTAGVASFLLPIRREYFLFFTVDDLKKNLKIEAEYDVLDSKIDFQELKYVNVELTIPLKGNKSITLKRTYKSKDLKDSKDPDYGIKLAQVGMGIFPFYQLHKDSGLRNEYSVYLYEEGNCSANLKFYSKESLDESVYAVKASRSDEGGKSAIYSLRNERSNTFDFIELNVDNNSVDGALLIPLWESYMSDRNSSPNNRTILSLDFGTSNTHVAYYDPFKDKPQTFSIGKDEMQMVLLNKAVENKQTENIDYRNKEGFGNLANMRFFLREFVPSVIGEENVQGIEYPVKTAAFRTGKLAGEEAKLFENVNIGYDINNEIMEVETGEYETDLKWAAQVAREKEESVGGVAKKLVQAYCEQTLWMLKNMIVIKNYDRNVDIVYFYPASMEDPDKEMFREAWIMAIEKVFTKCGFKATLFQPELESIAPYYSLLKNIEKSGKLYAHNSINIDIGGGTTDVFILEKRHRDPDTQEDKPYGYEASVQFAGDNIWSKAKIDNTPNGFVKYMCEYINGHGSEFDEDLVKAYNNVSNRKMADKDLAAFFFKNKAFKFVDRIKEIGHFKKTLFIHYASIIYYVMDMVNHIKKTNPSFKMPSTLTFTGKGSEYIKMISGDQATIAKLTIALFQAFDIEKTFGVELKQIFENGFNVAFTDNPKILTAEGGIYKFKSDDGYTFKEKDNVGIDINGYEGTSSRKTAEYEQIGKKVLGFEMEDDKSYYANKAFDYKDAVLTHFDKFIDAIFRSSDEFKKIDSKISFDPSEEEKKVKTNARLSFDVWAEEYRNGHKTSNTTLDRNMFFWAVANMLIDYSNEYKPKNN